MKKKRMFGQKNEGSQERSAPLSLSCQNIQPEDNYKVIQKLHTEEIEGFHYLRAIFSLMVVALKTNLVFIAEQLVSSSFALVLTANVGYLAVPVFFQMSLFLFYSKSKQKGIAYFLQKRFSKLVSLYLFWVGLKVLLDVVIKQNFLAINFLAQSPENLVEFIVSGGQSLFFFFFSLLLLNFLAAILISAFTKIEQQSTKLSISYWLLLISCLSIFLLSLSKTFAIYLNSSSMPWILETLSNFIFWDFNPFNFLPYLFTTLITVQELNQGNPAHWTASLRLKLYCLVSLFLCFTLIEWHVFDEQLHYARLSLVFGSWLLLYLAILSPVKAPKVIKFLSVYSLGIYGFHTFVAESPLLDKTSILGSLLTTTRALETLVSFLAALLGAIVLTLVAKQIKYLKNFV